MQQQKSKTFIHFRTFEIVIWVFKKAIVVKLCGYTHTKWIWWSIDNCGCEHWRFKYDNDESAATNQIIWSTKSIKSKSKIRAFDIINKEIKLFSTLANENLANAIIKTSNQLSKNN